jgi:hypothetical protein
MSFLGFRNAVSIGVSPHLTLGGSNLLGRLSPSLILQFAGAQTMDPRITFTRASTATYYGTQTALAEQNLLLQSQDFTTSWTTINSTVTANTEVAPDSTTTADTITDNATLGNHVITQTPTCTAGIPYTFSAFLKQGTNQYGVVFIFSTTANQNYVTAVVDLTAGTISKSQNGTSTTSVSTSIVSVGSGWYRVSVTGTAASAFTRARIGLTNSGTPTIGINGLPADYVGTGTTIYAWGAQLEQRSAVTAYTPTTTATVTNYIPVLETAAINAPRFDYNPITQAALGLLIEEQRTNLFERSQEFDNAYWTKSQSSITANTVIAPDGTLTGDKLIADSTSNFHTAFRAFAFTSGTTYSFSTFAKAGEYQYITLSAGNTGTFPVRVTFDLVAGVVSSTVAGVGSIQPVGNGWFRCVVVGTAAATASTGCNIAVSSTGSYVTYTGNGFNGIYIWGAQLEAGAFPTSYIPTVASQVTRSADAASMTGTNFSSWYNATEGTAYTEAASLATAYLGAIVGFSDGTLNNRFSIRGMTVSNQSTSLGVDSGVTQWSFIFSSQTTAATKFALGYKVDDIAFTRNAATPLTDASALIPVVNQLRIGAEGTGTQGYNGHIRQIVYYPRRLTNSDLQTITA